MSKIGSKPPSLATRIIVLVVVVATRTTNGFYVPGVAPSDFDKGDPIEVTALKMTSAHTQLPYEYYSLDMCKPKDMLVYKSQNLGEILRGDRIVNTPYEVKMAEGVECAVLCKDKVRADCNCNILCAMCILGV